ncbi:MAG TPA: ISL3 family transposase [Gaiellales bacterium]|nr:ISL3 family transposase [Gaiellales bacterium]
MATFMSCRWLLPEGLVVESIRREADSITVAARSAAGDAACPSCGGRSRRVHSRYHRTLSDLPCSDRVLRISVMVRRFRCTMAPCPARIFAERLGVAIAAPFARRTSRLERLGHHLGLALGGRPGAGLAARLRLPISRDTLLRTLRRRAVRPRGTPTVIGIDDWAWRRGQRYGTLICDLQRRQIIDLLPDREPATLDAWLAAHPEIAIVARDRGGGYGQAVTRVRPGVLQVADRWHLLANASAAFLDAVRRLMTAIRRTTDTAVVDPALLTRAERIQHDGYRRREQANAAIVGLAKGGMTIRAIVRHTGCSRKTVRQVVRGERSDVFRCRTSALEPWLDPLDHEWTTGCRNGAELWRRLQARGFRGSLRVVGEWATRRRRSERSPSGRIGRPPSARRLARLMMSGRNRLAKAEAVLVAAIERALPSLVQARELVERFQAMIRSGKGGDLDAWIDRAMESPLASFATGVRADQNAVAAAIVEPWSNGQTEGQITKLKLVKRQMYGRAKLDLLRARLVVGG